MPVVLRQRAAHAEPSSRPAATGVTATALDLAAASVGSGNDVGGGYTGDLHVILWLHRERKKAEDVLPLCTSHQPPPKRGEKISSMPNCSPPPPSALTCLLSPLTQGEVEM
ncbi:unnamed protein product [Pleuronectes platessa]|uniref:Uncharacterized protein n=1 Tax=Pleuronectes platessa TaxID=8262 RepID=A0A9N7YD03_PLEPL|nr:unnamed protein product [Pleuronectes platessa]